MTCYQGYGICDSYLGTLPTPRMLACLEDMRDLAGLMPHAPQEVYLKYQKRFQEILTDFYLEAAPFLETHGDLVEERRAKWLSDSHTRG